MKSICFSILTWLLLLINIQHHYSQGFDCYSIEIDRENPPPQTQPPQSSSCTPDYEWEDESGIDIYIPDENSQIYYVRINLHIMQKSDGTGNFTDNEPTHLAYLQGLIDGLNNIYSDNVEPLNGGPTGDFYIEDSKIRFILQNTYFHNDDVGWNNNGLQRNHYCFRNYKVNDRSELNIFLTSNPEANDLGGLGWALMYHEYNYVMIFHLFEDFEDYPPGTWPGELGGRHWLIYKLIAHEVGHAMGLEHTWSDNLDDTYYPDVDNWCSAHTDQDCSNNLMGKSTGPRHLSPKQMGKARKFLIETWRAGEVENCNSNVDYTINSNTIWDKPRVVFGDLHIMNSLQMDCNLYLPSNSTAYVHGFGSLLLNGGNLTSSCDNGYRNIIVENYGYLEISSSIISDYRIDVNNGGTIIIKDDLSITGNGCINVKNGGYICIENGAILTLQDGLSIINLYNGYNTGVNTDVLPDPGTCIPDVANYSYSGNGSINTFNDDVYIQNTTITEDEYVAGKNIFAGSNVDPTQDPGPVEIINGAKVIFNAEQNVIIEGEFEVESGSEFEIE